MLLAHCRDARGRLPAAWACTRLSSPSPFSTMRHLPPLSSGPAPPARHPLPVFLVSRSFGNDSKPTSTKLADVNAAAKGSAETRADRVLRRLRMHPEQLTPGPRFNRWLLVPAAITNHLCLGGVFAWSIFNQPLTRLHGVVAPAASDWLLTDVSLTFSLVMGGFVWGAVLGPKLDQLGPRASCLIGAACLGAGFGLSSLAIAAHNVTALYMAGAVWGLANGWAYVPPVATILKWFPDRKGFASGACILGYGGGAMIFAPLFTQMLKHFRRMPDYLGPCDSVPLVNQEGKLFAMVGDKLTEVVVATVTDLASWEGLKEGVYVVQTGSTGMSETLLVLAAGYWATMSAAALAFRLPHASQQTTQSNHTHAHLTHHDVDVPTAMRTPQFWLMWLGFGCAVTGSYGVLTTGATMLSECMAKPYPDIVNGSYAATFVAMMSFANMAGRIAWSSLSDVFAQKVGGDPFYGRKLTFSCMWGLGPPLYLAISWAGHNAHMGEGSMLPFWAFHVAVLGILSSFGGTAATRPALTGDVFGTRYVGTITARQLSVVLPAAWLGPKLATSLREQGLTTEVGKLALEVPDEIFRKTFGTGKEDLALLIQQKTVTIPRLLELLPTDTIDPTPFVYDQSLYLMASLQAVSFFTNMALKPVPPHLHMPREELTPKEESKEEEEAECKNPRAT